MLGSGIDRGLGINPPVQYSKNVRRRTVLSKSALIVLLLGVCFAGGGFLFIENLVRQEERANFRSIADRQVFAIE